MEKLFETSKPYEDYKHILEKAVEAEGHIYIRCDECSYSEYKYYPKYKYNPKYKYGCNCEHQQNIYIISNTRIKKLESYVKIILKKKIKSIFFLYYSLASQFTDIGDGYWFCIGQLNNGSYFAFETDCCYTGFGFGEQSYIYISKHKELLYNFGLTDKHRLLISDNIEVRFISIQGDLREKRLNGKKIQNYTIYQYSSDENSMVYRTYHIQPTGLLTDLFRSVSLSPSI